MINSAVYERAMQRTVVSLTGKAPIVSDKPSYLVWQPLPGPQTEAYNCPADELFYGGAAGGGKTDLALGLSLTAHRKSIIFRREYKPLRPIVDRMIEIVGNKDGLNQSLYIWRDLPGERMVEFGAMQHEHDKFNYKGNPHDLYVFDEASDFTESQVDFVTGWKRTTVVNQRTRVIFASNPPTSAEGEWIVRRFAAWLDPQHTNPALPGELRWFAKVDGEEIECADGKPFEHKGETVQPISRTFIPARVDDNPYYMATGYKTTLQSLPEPLRSQLLYGDFTIKANDDPWQVIPTEWVRLAQKRWNETPKPDVALRAIGNDVSHGGADSDVISRLYGVWFDELIVHPGKATPDGETAAKYVQDVWDEKAPIAVDAVGYGASACDTMKSWGMHPTPVNFGAATLHTDKSRRFKFSNIRAEAHWRLREALDPSSNENICLPPSRTLLVDLCAPRFQIVSGKIQLEPKVDVKQRIGRSPDEGEAVILAWYIASRSRMRVETW